MNSTMPKQFMLLAKKPLLMHSLNAFIQTFPAIVVVLALPFDFIKTWQQLCIDYQFNQPHMIASGGETRYHSVKNALALIPKDTLIAIHDGARPLVSPTLINEAFSSALKYGNAVPALQINESLRKLSVNDSQPVDRNQYRVIQTPQIFKSAILNRAYETVFHDSFTDDATVVEKLGEKIHLIPGEITNIKITFPSDLTYAELLLSNIETNF